MNSQQATRPVRDLGGNVRVAERTHPEEDGEIRQQLSVLAERQHELLDLVISLTSKLEPALRVLPNDEEEKDVLIPQLDTLLGNNVYEIRSRTESTIRHLRDLHRRLAL